MDKIETDKFGLHKQLKALPGKENELISILNQASETVTNEFNCLLYMVSQSEDDPESVWITEVWNSRVEHDVSLMNPKIRGLISQAIPLLASTPEGGKVLTIVSGI
jgi:quinol monooxygenase YgiN